MTDEGKRSELPPEEWRREEVIDALIESGMPAPMAGKIVNVIMQLPSHERLELLSSGGSEPSMLAQLAKELCEPAGSEPHLFPVTIVARNEDGTYDMELDVDGDYFRHLYTNHTMMAEMIGFELKKGVRFYSVPGDEKFPIDKSRTSASIGFRAMDISQPFAMPSVVIIGGVRPTPEELEEARLVSVGRVEEN